MATCKDCIHYEACQAVLDAAGFFSDDIEEILNAIKCPNFADKSRFVELPCKVGDKVFVLMFGCVISFIVERITLDSLEDKPYMKMHHGTRLVWVTELDEIGKTVFLTREEAEAVLAERRNE